MCNQCSQCKGFLPAWRSAALLTVSWSMASAHSCLTITSTTDVHMPSALSSLRAYYSQHCHTAGKSIVAATGTTVFTATTATRATTVSASAGMAPSCPKDSLIMITASLLNDVHTVLASLTANSKTAVTTINKDARAALAPLNLNQIVLFSHSLGAVTAITLQVSGAIVWLSCRVYLCM